MVAVAFMPRLPETCSGVETPGYHQWSLRHRVQRGRPLRRSYGLAPEAPTGGAVGHTGRSGKTPIDGAIDHAGGQ